MKKHRHRSLRCHRICSKAELIEQHHLTALQLKFSPFKSTASPLASQQSNAANSRGHNSKLGVEPALKDQYLKFICRASHRVYAVDQGISLDEYQQELVKLNVEDLDPHTSSSGWGAPVQHVLFFFLFGGTVPTNGLSPFYCR